MDKNLLKSLLLAPKTSTTTSSSGSSKPIPLLASKEEALRFTPITHRPPNPPRSPSPITRTQGFKQLSLPADELYVSGSVASTGDRLTALPVAKVPHLGMVKACLWFSFWTRTVYCCGCRVYRVPSQRESSEADSSTIRKHGIHTRVLMHKALIKDFVEEIQDIALSCSHLLQLFSHNLSLTRVVFNQDTQQWIFSDILKVTEHPSCFRRVKWAGNDSLLFGVSTDSTLYFGRVGDLDGLADKDDLDLGDLAAVTVVSVDGISDFAFSPDESVVAVGTVEGTVFFYSTVDASLLHTFEYADLSGLML
jgi:hypothetical protein